MHLGSKFIFYSVGACWVYSILFCSVLFCFLQILIVDGNLGEKKTCTDLIESTISKFKTIHVLVNNAVAPVVANIFETNDEELEQCINVNIKALFTLTKLAAPYLIKNRGKKLPLLYY